MVRFRECGSIRNTRQLVLYNRLASSAHCPTCPLYNLSFPGGRIPIPQEGLTTLGQTGSLWLDTRRLARQETWGHIGLIKRNYNNYIKITAARAQTIMNTRAIYTACWRPPPPPPPPPHTHTHTHTTHTHTHTTTTTTTPMESLSALLVSPVRRS